MRLCLSERGLDWESRLINLGTNEHLAPDYLALNLEEVFPDVPLMPKDPVSRADVRGWIRYLDEVPTPAVRVPSFNMAFLPRYDGLDDAGFQREQADIRPLRKHFYEKMGRKGFDDTEVDNAM